MVNRGTGVGGCKSKYRTTDIGIEFDDFFNGGFEVDVTRFSSPRTTPSKV